MKKDIRDIAKELGLSLILIRKNDKYCKANGIEIYLNNSHIAGNEIYLGIYDNKQNKIASFFHEVGHKLISEEFINRALESKKHWKFLIELECWRIGIELANRYGYFFDDEMYKYARVVLMSYL